MSGIAGFPVYFQGGRHAMMALPNMVSASSIHHPTNLPSRALELIPSRKHVRFQAIDGTWVAQPFLRAANAR